MIFVKVGDAKFPASVSGLVHDHNWEGRSSKAITAAISHEEAAALFVDGAAWSIIQEMEPYEVQKTVEHKNEETGEITTEVVTETVNPEPKEYDNSEYCVAGDITDHRDGTVTVKMGKLTELEETLAIVYGGAE